MNLILIMDIKKAETIIHNTVEITKPRWSQYDQTWKNIDLPFSLREIKREFTHTVQRLKVKTTVFAEIKINVRCVMFRISVK